jgi:hypothetical protein
MKVAAIILSIIRSEREVALMIAGMMTINIIMGRKDK